MPPKATLFSGIFYYFKQFGRYFGIVDIQANSDDDNCEVTLLRLSAG